MRITKCEEIKKTEDLIIFAMNSLSADGGNYCFCGIYYSANDKPHIVEYLKTMNWRNMGTAGRCQMVMSIVIIIQKI